MVRCSGRARLHWSRSAVTFGNHKLMLCLVSRVTHYSISLAPRPLYSKLISQRLLIIMLQVPIILATSLRSVTLVFTLAGIVGFVVNFFLVSIVQWQSVRTCHAMWAPREAWLARIKSQEDQFGLGEDAWSTKASSEQQQPKAGAGCCALGTAKTEFSSSCVSSKPSAIIVAVISFIVAVIAFATCIPGE